MASAQTDSLRRGTSGHAGEATSGKIKHVVIIVQENRSVDNLFQGYPGADTVAEGRNSEGQVVPLRPVSLRRQYTVDHSATAFFAACDGTGSLPGTDCKNDGFNNEQQEGGPKDGRYAYVPHNESRPYFDIAREFVLADHMFASQIDESFVAHQYIIAANASSAVDLPFGDWGCDGGRHDPVATLTAQRTVGPNMAPCFDHRTLGDELDRAGLSWRFYTGTIDGDGGVWSGYQAIRHIRYGPDWAKDVITPQIRFFTDLSNGTLSNVTWITPIGKNSDHPNSGGRTGPSWVTALVNAIGQSPFWDSTAIFVLWDDWGGMYDHVPPPFADYDGLGFRIPLLVISPYAKRRYVSHVQYETASVLRFVESIYGLRTLSASDARAASPQSDCFDFTQMPRPFVPIAAPFGIGYFLHQVDDHRPPDDD